MNNELIETKRIGPFILGKFVDENNDFIFAKISIRDPYPNGCQCKNSFLSLKDCYICIHTCILYSNLNKLDITDVLDDNLSRQELIVAIYEISSLGNNLDRLVHYLGGDNNYFSSQNGENQSQKLLLLPKEMLLMCCTVYSDVFKFNVNDGAFKNRFQIYFNQIRSHFNFLTPSENITTKLLSLRLVKQTFLQKSFIQKSKESGAQSILDIVATFIRNNISNSEQKSFTKLIYFDNEITSLRLFINGVVLPVIEIFGIKKWVRFFFNFRNACFSAQIIKMTSDDIFLSICVGENIADLRNDELIEKIKLLKFPRLSCYLNKFIFDRSFSESGYWIENIDSKGNVANLVIQELLKNKRNRLYSTVQPILQFIFRKPAERSIFINLIYCCVNQESGGQSFLKTFDLTEQNISCNKGVWPHLLAKKFTQNYFLLLVKIIAPDLFKLTPSWTSKNYGVELIFDRLHNSKNFQNISHHFGKTIFWDENSYSMSRSKLWFEPILWAFVFSKSRNETKDYGKILDHDTLQLHFPFCCSPYLSGDGRLITKSSCYFLNSKFNFPLARTSCPVAILAKLESSNHNLKNGAQLFKKSFIYSYKIFNARSQTSIKIFNELKIASEIFAD